jgi:ATP-dependent RNA helicase DDX3X
MVNNIELSKYSHPTPIQAYTIPAVIKGYDVIATAQTGKSRQKETFVNIHSR